MSDAPRAGVLRTPDDRFENLPGFPYAPRYAHVQGLRVHYVDEGPRDAAPVLLMHGEPSWCYLYRKMIPGLVAAGFRCIAPDLVGFGRSDKPARREDHSYAGHVEIMVEFVRQLDLNGTTLYCQDWGGLIGLRVVAAMPERFARIVASNTALPDGPLDDGLVLVDEQGEIHPMMAPLLSEGFKQWLHASQTMPTFASGRILQKGTVAHLPEDVVAAYNAPFPGPEHQAGPRVLPTLVASQLASNARAWTEVFEKWDKPFLTAFSDKDPVLGKNYKPFQKRIPGAQRQPHVTISAGGHFLQEDQGGMLAALLVNFIRENP